MAAHLPQALPAARRSKKKTVKRTVTDPQSWMEAWNVYIPPHSDTHRPILVQRAY